MVNWSHIHNPFLYMGKHIPFGPGHPDWENQLDMFDQLDAALADLHQVHPGPLAHSEMLPRDTVGYIPCPWCIGAADLEELQRAALSDGTPRGGYPAGDPECLLCEGKSELPARLRQADGYWWDWDKQVMFKAGGVEQARRKAKGSEPTPFYVEHGGYCSVTAP